MRRFILIMLSMINVEKKNLDTRNQLGKETIKFATRY
jgi:hypothetical protein